MTDSANTLAVVSVVCNAL